MKHFLRLTCFLTFVFSAIVSVGPRAASAQTGWTAVTTPGAFYGQIHAVKMADTCFGVGNGVLADDTGIWYTKTGGTSWARATITSAGNQVTPLGIAGYITDFAFASGQTIYAVLTNNPHSTDSGILVSNNGGQNWTFIDSAGTPDSGRGIYYNTTLKSLFVSGSDKGLCVLKNGAKSWTVIDPGLNYTGFAFNGNGHGIVCTEGSVCFMPNQEYFWLYTDDGGQTWSKSHTYFESWQPMGIMMTSTFFASTNNFCPPTLEILRSDNGGNSFAPTTGYTGGSGDTLTQSMGGDGCSIFASSAAQINSMWVSKNDGATFSEFPAAMERPAAPINTRFCVTPTTLWSFTTDTLFFAPRPPTGDIHIWPDTIHMLDASCGNITDTVVHIYGCNCANNPEIRGDSVHHLTTDIDTIHAILNPVPPPPPSTGLALCGESCGAIDSVTVAFEPTSPNSDSADINVLLTDNGTQLDTIVHFVGNGDPNKLVPLLKTLSIKTPACTPIDTCIPFLNPSCNTIIIDACVLSEATADECQLQMTGCCNFTQVTLEPGEQWCFPLSYQPGLLVSTSGGALLQLQWHAQGSNNDTLTAAVQVQAQTTTSLKPTFRGFDISEANCCPVPADTTIFFFNSTCDTITVGEPFFNSKNACSKNFSIINSKSFPVTVPPNVHAAVTIGITCTGADCSSEVIFPYTISANFDSNSACGGSVLCTSYATDADTVPISISVKGGLTPSSMSPNAVNFGFIGCCDNTEVRTVTITAGCRPDTLTNAQITGGATANFYIVQPGPSFPIPLAAGQSTTFQVGFLPLCNGGSGGAEKSSVTAKMSQAGTLTSELEATSTNLAASSLSEDTVNFGSILSCSQACDSVTIKNTSCGAIKVSQLTGATTTCFTVTGLPVNLALDSSATLAVCFNPSACKNTGAVVDSMILQSTDPNGSNGTESTLSFIGTVEPPISGYTLTTLASASICEDSSVTETFTLADTGTCYNYNIVTVASGSPLVTVTPTSDTLTPANVGGQPKTFTVTFNATQPGTFTGPIVLTMADGTTISVPYNFSDSNCTPAGQFTLSITPDTVTVPNCTPGAIQVTASAGGGSGSVQSLGVSGSPSFSVIGGTSGNMPFTGTIQFDPNTPGPTTATGTIDYTFNGAANSKTFTVYGNVVGVKDSARIGVINLTQGCILPNDTALDTMAIVLQDSIPPNTGLATLSFDIAYDGNLLWNPDTQNLLPGWTAVITSSVNGLHVVMTYTGTSGFSAGTTLMEITQLGAIADQLSTNAMTENVHFNDSAFEACTMKALAFTNDTAKICIDTNFCGAPVYYALHNNLNAVSNIAVVPNPAHKAGSAATLHFTTSIAAPVIADVLDVLGHAVVSLNNGPMTVGDHVLSIPTDNIPEGVYFARISVNGSTVIREFVLEKE